MAAESAGFPVAMKISANNLSHKTDSGGVRLNIPNAHAVRNVYKEMMETVQLNEPKVKINGITVEHMYNSTSSRELLIGISQDPVFGPAISFGMGGTTVEVHRDNRHCVTAIKQLYDPQNDRAYSGSENAGEI